MRKFLYIIHRRIFPAVLLPAVLLSALPLTASATEPPDVSFRDEVVYVTGNGPESIVVDDFDKDGNLDLFVVYRGAGSITLFRGSSDGTFNMELPIHEDDFSPTVAAVGDFDNNGYPDLAVTSYSHNQVVVFPYDSSGGLPPLYFSTGVNPYDIAAGDFDNDGSLDLVTGHNFDKSVSVLLNNGDGTFGAAMNISLDIELHAIALGDFDNDGNLDLAASHPSASCVTILLGNGDGTFPVEGVTVIPTGYVPFGITVGDFDDDGNPDIATVNVGTDNISVHLGNGDGTFSPLVNYDAGDGASYITMGDFNVDGVPDLVVDADHNAVSVLLGVGDGTFQPAVKFPAGTDPSCIAVGDFNGDGRSDLAVTHYEISLVSVLFNDTPLLSGLAASVGMLDPAFDPLTCDYTLNVAHTVTELDLTATLFGGSGQLAINGESHTSGAVKTIAPLGSGGTLVTIAASNQSGSVTRTYTVTINRPNEPPAAKNPVPVQTVDAGGTAVVAVSDVAEDGDNDPLSISAIVTPPDPAFASAALDGGAVTLAGIAKGITSLTVTVSDGMSTVDVTVPVMVNNTPPAAKNPVPVQTVDAGGTAVVAASDIAEDGDNDPLTITDFVTPPDPAIAAAFLDGGAVTFAGIAEGTTSLTVTVGDGTDDVNVTIPVVVMAVISIPPEPAYTARMTGHGAADITLPVAVRAGTVGAAAELTPALAKDVFDDAGTAVLTMPSIPGVTAYTVEIPAGSLSGAQGGGALTFATPQGSAVIPSGMLAGMPEIDGKTAGVTIGQGDKSDLPADVRAAVGSRPLIRLALTLDGKQTEWNNPNAPVTVSIPYTPTAAERENPESIVVWYIDGSGRPVCVPNGRFDPVTGTVTFTTTHFSLYAVSCKQVRFNDVAEDAWYAKAVSFIAAREITDGTGGGDFSPDAKLTRSAFLVMLMRAYGISPDDNPADNFADAGNTWYTGYLAAAKRLGISAGVGGNMFAPEREITRQEMFTLLYNTLKIIGQLPQGSSGKTLSDFGDADDIAPWAGDAMALLVETGIITGSGNRLSPQDTATRAQMAQVLYSLLAG